MNIQMNDDNVYRKVNTEELSELLKQSILILKDEIDVESEEHTQTNQLIQALNNLKITMDEFDKIIKPKIPQEKKLSISKNMIVSHQVLIQVFSLKSINASDEFYAKLQEILESFTVFYPIFIINNQLYKIKEKGDKE